MDILPCDEPGCDYRARGPATGPGNVNWRMAVHRRQAHGVKGASAALADRVERLESIVEDVLERLGLEVVD